MRWVEVKRNKGYPATEKNMEYCAGESSSSGEKDMGNRLMNKNSRRGNNVWRER